MRKVPAEYYAALQSTLDAKNRILAEGKTPCISFGRISSTRQMKGNSLDFQLDDAHRHMESHGMEAAFEIQTVESAKTSGRRPDFELILWLAGEAKIPDLLFYNGSRVTRNAMDAARVTEMIESGKIRVHTYQDGKVCSAESSEDDLFVLSLGFGMHWLENMRRARGARRNHIKNRDRGVASQAPRRGGYVKGPDKRYIKDPDPIVQKAVMFIHDSWDYGRWPGLQAAIEELNESRVLTYIPFVEPRRQRDGSIKEGRHSAWTVQSLRQWLQNPFWCGKFYSRTEDKLFEGSQEPYITVERWKKRVEKAGWHFSHRSRTIETPGKYDGLIRCTCGMGLYREPPKKGKYIYYAHSCKHHPNSTKKGYQRRNVSVERLDTMVYEQLRSHHFGPQFTENLRTLIKAVEREYRKHYGQENALLTRQISELTAQKHNILRVLGLNKIDDIEALNSELNRINREISSLEAERSKRPMRDRGLVFKAVDIAETLQVLPGAILNAPAEGQREILMDLIDSMELDKEQNLRLIYKPMFAPLMREGVLDLVNGVREFEAVLPR